ncbi:MAG TPA: nitroreductase family protein [Acetobacteraceae bacterium]|nr:nitroreductase family protein [Acetobacteraceae bacterium]
MDIGLFEAIHSARSLRRLKPDPVPEALITQVLDAAIRAPSAGNAQNWAFVVVRDAAKRQALGEIYRKGSRIAEVMYAARGQPAHMTERQYRRMMTTGAWLWEHMGDAPVILFPCQHRPVLPPVESLPATVRYEDEVAYVARIRGSSIYPAVQNIILACRGLGLGTTITTNHLRCEDEVRALLGLPDDVDTFAMMPIGWPMDAFGPLSRKPLAAVVHRDRWGDAWDADPVDTKAAR